MSAESFWRGIRKQRQGKELAPCLQQQKKPACPSTAYANPTHATRHKGALLGLKGPLGTHWASAFTQRQNRKEKLDKLIHVSCQRLRSWSLTANNSYMETGALNQERRDIKCSPPVSKRGPQSSPKPMGLP